MRRVDVVGAAKDFERALEADSTFALAALGLRMASSWYGDPTLQQRGLDVAWRERARLSQRDQSLLVAIGGPRYPRASDCAGAADGARAVSRVRTGSRGRLVLVRRPRVSLRVGAERPESGGARTRVVPAGVGDRLELRGRLSARVAALAVARRYRGGTSVRAAAPGGRHDTLLVGAPPLAARVFLGRLRCAVARSPTRSTSSQYVYGMDQIAFYDGTGEADVRRGLDSALRRTSSDPQRRGLERIAHDFELAAGRPQAALQHLVASADSANDVNIPVLKVRDALIADGDTSAAVQGARIARGARGGTNRGRLRAPILRSERQRASWSLGVSHMETRRRRGGASTDCAR